MPAEQPPPEGPARNPGSQPALRLQNQQRVLAALLDSGPLTQTELARQTGLSTATISNIVKTMTFVGALETAPTTSSGRRASLVRLPSGGSVAVGMDFGRDHLRVILTTLGYEILAEELIDLGVGYPASDGIERAAKVLNRLLASQGILPPSVLAVGACVPGPIDRNTHTVMAGTLQPQWVGIRSGDLETAFRLPVMLDSVANLCALAEISCGQHNSTRDLLFVTVGDGIGAGLILNGNPYYGAGGLAGEIGSTSAMAARLSAGDTPVRVVDIIVSALAGDPKTLRVVDEAGLAIGRSIAAAANLLNPELIVIGGELAVLGDVLLAPIRAGLAQSAAFGVAESTTIVMSALGDRGGALGAAALVLRQPGVRAS